MSVLDDPKLLQTLRVKGQKAERDSNSERLAFLQSPPHQPPSLWSLTDTVSCAGGLQQSRGEEWMWILHRGFSDTRNSHSGSGLREKSGRAGTGKTVLDEGSRGCACVWVGGQALQLCIPVVRMV